jgi:alkylation response protein AidB-like acyl-CoA dehydrogenase
MDLTLTEDQRLIASTAREVLTARHGSAGFKAVASEATGYSGALWKEMVDLGWPGLPFAESYGGVGLGFLEFCLLLEEAGHAGVPSPLASTVACCGLPIARYGTETQKQEWLGAIAQGRVMTYVRAAPGGWWGAAGSDVTVSDHLTLDGTALFVPYAQAAEDLLVVAQSQAGLTVLLVDAGSEGISKEPMGTVGADRMCRMTFADVSAPADRVLGEDGNGAAVVEAIEQYGAAAACAEMVGGAQGVLDKSVEYATQREQFGKPIGSFQAVQHHCANMAIDVLGSRFLAYEAIWRLSAGLDAATEVSAAKAWVSEAYQRVCSLGHQVHGAIGFTAEHDLHTYLRHAIGSALAFGDGDFHTELLARKLGL